MRRTRNIAGWILGGLTLLMLALGGIVMMVGNTGAGRAAMEKLTYRLTRGHVKISGLAGSFPHHLVIERLQLSDALGPWLTAEHIALDWSPFAYLRGRLQVDSVQIARVDVQRLPTGSSTVNGSELSIPQIDVGRGSIELLQLDAQLAGAPASLVARGSAHLRSLRDMALEATAHRVDGDGDYELHLRFDPKRMDTVLKVHEPAGGPLENVLSLPGLGELSATINLSGPRTREQLELSLKAGGLSGNAEGSLNLNDLSADIQFAFQSTAMNPRPDWAWDRAALRGRWQGSVKSPTVTSHVEVVGLRMPDAQLATLNADIDAELGKAGLHASLGGLRIPGPQPQLLEDGPVTIDASMHLDDPLRRVDMLVSHKLISVRAEAQTAGVQSASAQLRLPSLRPFAALAGLELRGSALVNAQLDGYPAAPHLKADAAAALDPGTEAWAAALGDRARLQLSATLKNELLTVDSLKFSGHAVSASANGTASRGNIKGRWDFELPDLKVLSPILAGALTASGSIDGPTTALSADALLNSTVSVRGSPSANFSAVAHLNGWPADPTGLLTVQGSLDGAPLLAEVALQGGPGASLRAQIHRASWKSAQLDGEVTMAASGGPAHGRLGVVVANLEDLQNLLGLGLAGSLQANIGLQPDRQRNRVALQLDAKDVAWANLVGNVHVSGEGFNDSFGFNANLRVPDLRGAAATLAAKGILNLAAGEISVSSALLNYRGQDARLLSPSRIDFASGVSIDSLKLGIEGAELVVQGKIAPVLALRASLHGVAAPLVNEFVPNLLATGSIEAHADLHGSVTSPTGEIEVNATGMRRPDDAALGLPLADLHLTAALRGHTADIDARLDAGSASRLRAVGAVPIAFDGAVDVKVGGKFDIGMINPFLEARGLHASGQLDIDATVAGSVTAPQIGGTVNLTRGSLRDYARGLSFTDIAAQLTGSEGTLQIKSFTASAAPGELSMTGTIGVLQSAIPVDLRITARKAQPIASNLVTSNLDADLHVSGTARKRLDIAGTVHLNRTLIGIPNGLPPNVAVLDVRRRGHTAAPVADKPLIIGMDVTVKAPQEILVQGRGLDAEMGGELHFGGTTAAPVVSGGFDLQRGSFSLASSRLNFTAGRVSFNGLGLKNKIDPTLDFTAQATVALATTVTMHITGLADSPVFEFTSTPMMPQDEIMGYLMFGESVAQLTPIQMAQIGLTLASLSGVGGDGGLNPLVMLQRSLGLDRLTMGAATTTNTATGTESSGASIAAGRYIAKHVYIEAKQTTAGTSQLGAVVDLTKHLKLQTRLGNGAASIQGTTPENDPGSSIGLLYQFEY
jgi:translocation and assembly module TamB